MRDEQQQIFHGFEHYPKLSNSQDCASDALYAMILQFARHTLSLVYGYACGLDMTRRDLQLAAREQGRPWDLGKDVERSSIVSTIVPMPGVMIERGRLSLAVNGAPRQRADISQLIWNIREIVADLSQFYRLVPGDLVFTGTPEGVGTVVIGDKLVGSIDGVGTIELTIGAAEVS